MFRSPEGFDYDVHVNDLTVDERKEMMSKVIETGVDDVIIAFKERRVLVQRSRLNEIRE